MDTRNGTGDEVACVRALETRLTKASPDALRTVIVPRSRGKSDSAYVFASWGVPRTVLNVHIDTVPSGQGWDADPLQLRRKDGRLIGLGTSDIKGAAACILAALETVTPKNVGVLFSGDEEHGSEIMPAVIRSGILRDTKCAVICEPTSCELGQRHRGMLAFSMKFSGPGGHSSLADLTARPLLDAARLAAAIGDYGDAHRDFGAAPYTGLCTNIGELRSDGAYNVIPTQSSLWVSMRPPPGDNVGAREDAIRDICAKLTPHAEIDTIVAFPPFASRDISAFAPVFKAAPIVDLPYWTEAAMMSEAGINAVVFGPGEIDQAHKPNESVPIAQLQTAMGYYADVLAGELS